MQAIYQSGYQLAPSLEIMSSSNLGKLGIHTTPVNLAGWQSLVGRDKEIGPHCNEYAPTS